MKFKVETRDFVLFVIYSVILLYLCCILVLNFYSFTSEGTFYGLLPFRAFTMPFLPVTFIIFGAVMAVIFTNVSSYIFSKDKEGGFGLKFKDKATDGFSRWSTVKEIKKSKGAVRINRLDPTLDAAGVPLISTKKELWVDNGEYHSLVIGSTGSGKSQMIVKPLVNVLAKKGESMIITDPKGELYRDCGNMLKDRGYNIIVLNFRNPQNGNSWNPLSLPYYYYKNGNSDKATELLDDVANNILYEENNKSDSDFWEKSAADYFSGLALGLFGDAEEKEVNLNSINLMSTVGEERYATSNYIKEYFLLKGEASSAYIFASNTINAPTETKGGILSTFRQKIRKFSTQENLSEMLSYSDFDMNDIGKKKTAVFLLIHDEKTTYHSLMTIFIKQCYETLIDVAQKTDNGKLPYRTNFILDEFANMPPLKDVDSMVSAARSRDIRFTFIIQNFAQLNDVYGQEVAQVIRGNCGNLMYLISSEMAALKEISEMCGEIKVKTGKGDSEKEENRPLISVSDLQKLKMWQIIIIRIRTNPFMTKFEPDFRTDWGIKASPADLPSRTKEPIHLFDVKKFVTEAKNKKMQESGMGMGMNPGMPGMSPFGMPPSSPFGPMGGSSNPFGPTSMGNMGTSPFGNPSGPSSNPFAPGPSDNSLNNMDIEAMMKDIDNKIKELEEEERKEQEEKAKKEKEAKSTENAESNTTEVGDSLPKAKEEVKNELVDKKDDRNDDVELLFEDVDDNEETKPVVNVDKDSIVVKENVISDDEFFDDFFDENE